MNRFKTLKDLLAWLNAAPDGTQIHAATMAGLLTDLMPDEPAEDPELRVVDLAGAWTWKERIWTAPAERRLSVREACEALGKGRTWLYARMKEERGLDRIPHRKMDGEVFFTAGELRAWIRDQEDEICGGRMDSTAAERRGVLRVG